MARALSVLAPVVLAALAVACTTDEAETMADGSADSSASAESPESAEGPEGGDTGCGDPLRLRDCTEATRACQGFQDQPGMIFEDNGACIWPVLRDRAVGEWVTIELESGDSPTTVSLLVAEDGALMRQQSQYLNANPCSIIEPLQACSLRDAAFFDACLTTVTPECLTFDDWYSGCENIDACL